MYRATSSVKRFIVGLTGVVLLLCLAAGCVNRTSGEGSDDPLEQPELLTPIAKAQEAGIPVYWLGRSFRSGQLEFDISGYADTGDADEILGIQFEYGSDTGNGSVVVTMVSFSGDSEQAAESRQKFLSIPGATSQDAQVGPWRGELVFLPAGTRPVNQLHLFVDVEEATVAVQALSGATGVPGDDPNPLIDKDLLIQVVAENLRPYPE